MRVARNKTRGAKLYRGIAQSADVDTTLLSKTLMSVLHTNNVPRMASEATVTNTLYSLPTTAPVELISTMDSEDTLTVLLQLPHTAMLL
jgi:hypothetical protein